MKATIIAVLAGGVLAAAGVVAIGQDEPTAVVNPRVQSTPACSSATESFLAKTVAC
jgi:hypothetical protein